MRDRLIGLGSGADEGHICAHQPNGDQKDHHQDGNQAQEGPVA
jgi:hypothetical protein